MIRNIQAASVVAVAGERSESARDSGGPEIWGTAAGVYASAVRDYLRARDAPACSPPVESTVRTNSTLVPRRGNAILGALAAVGSTLSGRRVVEVGSGFGALSAYIALRGRPHSLLELDVRPDYLRVARQCALVLGLDDRLSFRCGDVRDPRVLEEASFDAVVASGVLLYLVSDVDLELAILSIGAALAPGGHLVVYQANRWWPVDRTTGRPLVHLLPRSLSRAEVRREEQRHIRLISAPELTRRVRRCGFKQVRVSGFARDRRLPSPLRSFGSAFTLCARKAP